jgi:hypothetical protein
LTGIEADDVSFILPPFETIRHRAKDSRIDRELADLFGAPAISAANMYDIKRQTSGERAKIAVQIINDEINRWLVQKSTEASMLKTDMPPIQHIEKIGERRQEREQNHKDFQAASNRLLEFQNKTTEPCFTSKTEDAPSAVPMSREDAEDGTSITVTTPIKFGDCSAIDATSALANSMKTRKLSGEQPTILKGERIPAWVLWCDTNDEQQTVERLLGDLCISIYGSQPADKKEELHEAWLNGVRPVLVTKPSIFGFGCDWNHCHNMIFLGRSFSYETWYQAVRRCWRFGQKRKVVVHLIVAEGETEIGRVIDRKAGDHARMKDAMRHAMLRATGRSAVVKEVYNPTQKAKVPEWLR